MKNNPHLGNDALAFLNKIVPDTPETCRVEQQEIFRLALTQALREVRKKSGLTQEQLAERLGVEESWVSNLENINYDRTFEAVIAYLDAMGAKLDLSFVLQGEIMAVTKQDTIATDIFTKS